ncbi:MAG: WG repeat-containing protein [Clostridia bacterium]|nr:WG repeat-containing protein [Clostridia bacterium]
MSEREKCDAPLPEESEVSLQSTQAPLTARVPDTPVLAGAGAHAIPDPDDEEPCPRRVQSFLFLVPLLLVVASAVFLIVYFSTHRTVEVVPTSLFSEGLLPVAITEVDAESGEEQLLWGYIDRGGNTVIEHQFEAAKDFSAVGLAAVKKDGKWGFINRSGTFVIEPQYEDAQGFAEFNFACVRFAGSWGYINQKGEMIINPQFDSAEAFTDIGLAMVEIGGKYGYINRTGVYVIPPQYENARSFDAEGHAAVLAFGKWGMIDKNGEYFINPQFDRLDSFAGGDLALICKDEMYGYINKEGVYVVRPTYEYAEAFADNGLALIRVNGKYGYINKKGEIAIAPELEAARSFADSGLAAACRDGLWGFINKNGEFTIEPTYYTVSDFMYDRAVVRLNAEDPYMCIDKDGKIAFTCDESCLLPGTFFDDGYTLFFYEDENGEMVATIVNRDGVALNKTRYAAVSERVLASFGK